MPDIGLPTCMHFAAVCCLGQCFKAFRKDSFRALASWVEVEKEFFVLFVCLCLLLVLLTGYAQAFYSNTVLVTYDMFIDMFDPLPTLMSIRVRLMCSHTSVSPHQYVPTLVCPCMDVSPC